MVNWFTCYLPCDWNQVVTIQKGEQNEFLARFEPHISYYQHRCPKSVRLKTHFLSRSKFISKHSRSSRRSVATLPWNWCSWSPGYCISITLVKKYEIKLKCMKNTMLTVIQDNYLEHCLPPELDYADFWTVQTNIWSLIRCRVV